MAKTTKLSKRQRSVIDELFVKENDEQKVLDNYKVSRSTFEKWQNEPAFIECIDSLIAIAHRRYAITIANNAQKAAKRLMELAKKGEGETSRKACLDIISLNNSAGARPIPANKQEPENPSNMPQLSAATAAKLLAVLAEEAGIPQIDD